MDSDGIFSMLFCHKASSFVLLPVDGYYWYLHDDSVSGRKKSKKVQFDRINTWIRFYIEIEKMDKSLVTNTEKGYLIYFYRLIAWTFIHYSMSNDEKTIIEKSRNLILKNYVKFREGGDAYDVPRDMKLFMQNNFLWIYGYYRYYINKFICKKLRIKK